MAATTDLSTVLVSHYPWLLCFQVLCEGYSTDCTASGADAPPGVCHLAGTLLGRLRIQQPELEITDREVQLVVRLMVPSLCVEQTNSHTNSHSQCLL